MGSTAPWLAALDQPLEPSEPLLGGKAASMVKLTQANLHIAKGFCLTTAAYRHFVRHNALDRVIALELGRKPLEKMRWEELWDAALRIRSAFSKGIIPPDLAAAINAAHRTLGQEKTLAVRSSAPGEDSVNASFAGLHESVLDVTGRKALTRAVRLVWASLWSDAALLYRRELALDPMSSSMAVLVQELVEGDVSGVAFSRDPTNQTLDQAVLEAVPGRCSNLVDGLVEPDRWTLSRATAEVLTWTPGRRDSAKSRKALLQVDDLRAVLDTLLRIEALTGDPIDLEWTKRAGRLTLLQARPISSIAEEEDETRRWYLSLRPAPKRLKELAYRVARVLIPELEALGYRFSLENLAGMEDGTLADALIDRLKAIEHWRKVYWNDFIPFAHGVRQLGLYYNDRVRPDDPYEFVGLLRGENLLALQRNQRVEGLVAILQGNPALRDALGPAADFSIEQAAFQNALADAQRLPGGAKFVTEFNALLSDTMDVTYGGRRVAAHPEHLLHHLFQMAQRMRDGEKTAASTGLAPADLEQRFFAAVDAKDQTEAEEILAIGRLAWRLRDDDNLLLARLEAQLIKGLGVALERLSESGRLVNPSISVAEQHTFAVAEALRDCQRKPVALADSVQNEPKEGDDCETEKPRQLVGQPAAPGMVTGLARIIESADDLQLFRAGEIIVCGAIEPTMTHLVPLARAIVEQRGGMLIHGAIIARELGIPCVNGIPKAVTLLHNGDLITVDGHLGIVTVGAPEFDIEGVHLNRPDSADTTSSLTVSDPYP